MNLGIERACRLFIPTKYLYQINNNFCIYCGGANYHARNYLKAVNQKTSLYKMVVNSDKRIFVKQIILLITLLSTDSKNL